MTLDDLRVVVVTWNSGEQVAPLLSALRAAGIRDEHCVFVDNASQDGTTALLSELCPEATVLQTGRNAGYAAAVNHALRALPMRHPVLVMNPDTRPGPDAVPRLLAAAGGRDVGIVAPALLDAEGERRPNARRDPRWWRTLLEAVIGGRGAARLGVGEQVVPPPDVPTDIDWCTGAALLLTPAARSAVPEWEESYFLYSEEVDYCQRVRAAGLRVVLDPRATVVHVGGELHTDSRLWALRTANRVLHEHHTSPPVRAGLFHLASLLFEARRRALGRASAPGVLGLRSPAQLLTARDRLLPADVDAPLPGPIPVIVPAHQEGRRVARTLEVLLRDASPDEFDVVVVVNGSTDATADVARSVVSDEWVLEVEEASKTNAIRVGERHLGVPDERPVVYLDADVELTTTAARRLVRLVARTDVEAGSPTPVYVLGASSWPVRSYLRIWQHLPFTHDALAGTGVYVLAPAARSRFRAWPDVVNDDGWINAVVPRGRRRRAPDAISLVGAPADVPELLRRKIRVRRGNVALRADHEHASPPTTVPDLLGVVWRRPWRLIDLPAFLWVTARHRLQRDREPTAWR